MRLRPPGEKHTGRRGVSAAGLVFVEGDETGIVTPGGSISVSPGTL